MNYSRRELQSQASLDVSINKLGVDSDYCGKSSVPSLDSGCALHVSCNRLSFASIFDLLLTVLFWVVKSTKLCAERQLNFKCYRILYAGPCSDCLVFFHYFNINDIIKNCFLLCCSINKKKKHSALLLLSQRSYSLFRYNHSAYIVEHNYEWKNLHSLQRGNLSLQHPRKNAQMLIP
jgi:hypothetical protein